jgi:hypothetical protein
MENVDCFRMRAYFDGNIEEFSLLSSLLKKRFLNNTCRFLVLYETYEIEDYNKPIPYEACPFINMPNY